jgi:uncharacterized protein (TIGR03000 family)
MFRQAAIILAAVVTVLCLTVGPAAAQFGPGQQGPNWDRAQFQYRARTYVEPTVPAAAPVEAAPTTSQSFYIPETDNRGVFIQMQVPEGARVWFDNTPTMQTGTVRQFLSPPINPGQDYVYQIRVEWPQKGEVMNLNRRVTVRPGDRLNLDFTGKMNNESR